MNMLKGLKSLDKILLGTFIVISIAGIVSGLAVNRILTNLLFQRSKDQIISSTELIARAATAEMDTGNFRNAWVMIQLNLGKNNFTDFLLLDGAGTPLVSDTQAETKIFPFWKDGMPIENINFYTKIKKLRSSGDFISEFKFKNLGNSSGSYSLLLLFSDSELTKVQYQISLYIWSYYFLLIVFMGYIIFVFRIKLLSAIRNVNDSLEAILHGDNYENKGTVFAEYIQSKQTLEKFTLEFSEAKLKLEDQVKIKIFGNLASQVAHDIRSPLSALNMVTESITNLPTQERLLMKNAIQRINDIANDLLQKGKQANTPDTEKILTLELIPAIVDLIVSEKRMQYREFSNLIIEADLSKSFGAFAKVNASELKRVVSNLVNNSVEAFKNHTGCVTIGVRNANNQIEIFIQDNGKGIPPHLINQLGQEGFSHGKEAKEQSGSGLGLFHAKQTAEKFNGSLIIESTENSGTLVTIRLPQAMAPEWFASIIDFSDKSSLVTLDDDSSIHQIWSSRLKQLDNNKILHRKFQSGEQFKIFVKDNQNALNDILFLVDYELLNQKQTGMDIIEELGIGKNSILVTSLYDDYNIQQRAKAQHLIILPKTLAAFVPIKLPIPNSSSRKYDIILLDNDPLVCLTWEMKAKRSGKNILILTTAKALWEKLDEIDKDCVFYVDVHLTESDNADGVQITKQLFELGYLNLYLATGYEADKFSDVTWIKGVVGKSPVV